MVKGIKNPYAKPKAKFNASTGKSPYNTEYQEPKKGDIRLDGGGHTIVLGNTDVEEIPQRLGELFREIAESLEEDLAGFGIALCSKYPTISQWVDVRALSETHMVLPTPCGNLYICSQAQDEDEAFNLMGRALARLPVRTILKSKNTKVIVRA